MRLEQVSFRLLALQVLLVGCNERFDFDIPDAGTGTGGDAADAQVASTGGTGIAQVTSTGGTGTAQVTSGGGTGGTRPGCMNDSDCVLAALQCDPTGSRCVECTTDADCSRAEAPRCDGQLQRCVGCVGDADCSAGWECDALERRCAQTCEALAECAGEAHACLDGRCLACDRDVECRDVEGTVCSSSGLACVGCRDDAQCPTDLSCDVVTGRCVECVSSPDCPDGSFCHPTELTCL
jgi:hypothetical protein